MSRAKVYAKDKLNAQFRERFAPLSLRSRLCNNEDIMWKRVK